MLNQIAAIPLLAGLSEDPKALYLVGFYRQRLKLLLALVVESFEKLFAQTSFTSKYLLEKLKNTTDTGPLSFESMTPPPTSVNCMPELDLEWILPK